MEDVSYQLISRIGVDTCDTENKIDELNLLVTINHLETFLAALMAILVMRIALTIQANIRLQNMLECGRIFDLQSPVDQHQEKNRNVEENDPGAALCQEAVISSYCWVKAGLF